MILVSLNLSPITLSETVPHDLIVSKNKEYHTPSFPAWPSGLLHVRAQQVLI